MSAAVAVSLLVPVRRLNALRRVVPIDDVLFPWTVEFQVLRIVDHVEARTPMTLPSSLGKPDVCEPVTA